MSLISCDNLDMSTRFTYSPCDICSGNGTSSSGSPCPCSHDCGGSTLSLVLYVLAVPAVCCGVPAVCLVACVRIKRWRAKARSSGNASLLPGRRTPNHAAVPLCFTCGEMGHAARDCPN